MNIEAIAITPRATEEIKHILAHKNIPKEYALRVGVKGGGCGIGYLLGFDKRKETDLLYEMDGISVLIEKRQLMYMIGVTVDFHDGDDARGFIFRKDAIPTDAK